MSAPSLEALASQIQAEHDRCRASFQHGLTHALEAGRLLIVAQDRVGHGQWLPWLRDHCPDISERLAQRYMRGARDLPKLQTEDPANTTRVTDLSFRGALELIAANAKAARKIPEPDRPNVIETVAQQKLENLTEAKERYQSNRKRKRARFIAERRQHTITEQRNAEYPYPDAPPGGIRISGFNDEHLAVILEELKRSGDWYHDLSEKLNQVYEPRLRQLAMEAVNAIWALRDRLTYDRDQLKYAVYGLRELLQAGPVSGTDIRRWTRKAGITEGLLHLARKLIGATVRHPAGGGGMFHKTTTWTLSGDEPLAEA